MLPRNVGRRSHPSNWRHVDIEAALLTGGASRRMGRDKAKLEVDGRPLAETVASRILSAGIPVTVLGPDLIPGCSLQQDATPHAGPLVALSCFCPRAEYVFVCSCDLPLFDGRLIEVLADLIEDMDAAIPLSQGRPQPLCALYRAGVLSGLREWLQHGSRRVMEWIETLSCTKVSEERLERRGISRYSVLSANTPEELALLLSPEVARPEPLA